ncbi:rhodopsin [Halobacteriales archaeon QS_3_64_16]|nr:MAG: rhodopsin [Halobacteriales archaeon QS_3_64_16]
MVQSLPALLNTAAVVLQAGSVEVGGESIWLWLGTAGMFLGMLAFIGMGWGETDQRRIEHYVITIFIPAIAFTMYLAMALGFGVTGVQWGGETHAIYWARYADWLFTTPLLLIDLALLVGADRNTIATLVGLDVAMIGTGVLAALTGSNAPGNLDPLTARIIWWGVSTAFLVILLYFLVGQVSEMASRRSGAANSLFSQLRNVLIVLWAVYPVLWIVGTEGLGLIPLFWETAGFMVLDLSAKVGFGYILLANLDTLELQGTRQNQVGGATADD